MASKNENYILERLKCFKIYLNFYINLGCNILTIVIYILAESKIKNETLTIRYVRGAFKYWSDFKGF